ncbi:ATP-binding protein [Streptomyces physcomitrii]|uniref:ATP-binding protein n=1 Tax=Streptomyces physcomitrii TaxID=2724184 RepID=A0ABX1H9M3_9ACTN|nr:ATP-binding protein [Streptomyces physcomitrii]NKI45081.1 ATP-binding protein [Streptomyces physcomitrii]
MTRQIRGTGSAGHQSGGGQAVRATGTALRTGRTALTRRIGRAELRAVPAVRREVRALVSGWGRPAVADTAELLTCELVTNALLHTEGEAVLTVLLGPDQLRVEVRDFAGRRPRPRGPRPEGATGGRGLQLVEMLAGAWGVDRAAGGKTVWFELGEEG